MKTQERSLLIDALLDGSINEADRLRIEAELIRHGRHEGVEHRIGFELAPAAEPDQCTDQPLYWQSDRQRRPGRDDGNGA